METSKEIFTHKALLDIPDGIYTVLVTPFKENNTIDYDSIRKWFEYQVNSDVTGVVLMGTTSESPTMKSIEVFSISKYIYELNSYLESPKFIIIGIGGNDTQKVIDDVSSLVAGKYAHGFMVTVPSYNKPTQEGIYQHFNAIANSHDISKFPVIMYNVPGRTSVNMEPTTIKRICESCPNVVAIKEASGSMDQVMKIRTLVPTLKVFAGDDKLILDFMAHGASGVISVASNIIPDIMVRIYQSCAKDLFVVGRTIFYELRIGQFVDLLFCESNPIPVKFMLWVIGLYKNYKMRLPMTELSSTKHGEVSKLTLQLAGLNTLIMSMDEITSQIMDSSYLYGSLDIIKHADPHASVQNSDESDHVERNDDA